VGEVAEVIHVVTVHWRSPQWVRPQLAYLRRHVVGPFRVVAALDGIEDRSLWAEFDHAEELRGPHGEKLNTLAAGVMADADPDDVLIFLDSDAFPVRPLEPWLLPALDRHGVVAVQRHENFGDLRPHPSFCAARVRTWVDIGGDWTKEPWTSPSGSVLDDAGTRVLAALETHGVEWLPLLRTNTTDLHPLWFGVYGHAVYHHGAGSRSKWSLLDATELFSAEQLASPSLRTLTAEAVRHPARVRALRPAQVRAATVRSWLQVRMRVRLAKIVRASDRVFQQLVTDPGFSRQFDARTDDQPGSEG
jgi:hypothetical protein